MSWVLCMVFWQVIMFLELLVKSFWIAISAEMVIFVFLVLFLVQLNFEGISVLVGDDEVYFRVSSFVHDIKVPMKFLSSLISVLSSFFLFIVFSS